MPRLAFDSFGVKTKCPTCANGLERNLKGNWLRFVCAYCDKVVSRRKVQYRATAR